MNNMDRKNLMKSIELIALGFAAITILFLVNRLTLSEAATAFWGMVAAMVVGKYIFWSVAKKGEK